MESELSNFSWDLFGEATAMYTSRGEDAQCHRFGSPMLFSTTVQQYFLEGLSGFDTNPQAPSVSKLFQPSTPT